VDNLQLLLVGGKGAATDLSIHLSESEGALFVFLGLSLLERVRSDSNCLAYKMLLGRLVNSGIPVRELERTFGHEHRTLKRWGEALLRDDLDFVVRAFAGQGAVPKVTAAAVAFVRGRYAQLKGTVREYRRQIAAEVRACFGVDLSRETLRLLFADRAAAAMDDDAATPVEVGDPAEPAEPGRDVEAVCATARGSVAEAVGETACEALAVPVAAADLRDSGCPGTAVSCGSEPVSDNHSPTPLAKATTGAAAAADLRDSGCPETAVSCGSGSVSDNHSPTPLAKAATWAAATADTPEPGTGMVGSGSAVALRPQAVHHAGQVLFSPWLDVVGSGRDAALSMHTQWLGQILQGAVNIEQSKSVCAASLSLFIGPVVPGTETQRHRLWEQATPEAALEVLAANARLLRSGPGRGWRFYYDPHTKQYTGELELLKGWCGRRHSVEKVLHLDMIHTVDGDPCFVAHYDNFYDLRERFFMTLCRFDELFPAGLRTGRLFVLDRAIFGRDTFELFFARGDWLVTWEKGYRGDAWDAAAPTVEFFRTRCRNHAGNVRTYRFQCQESGWPQDGRVRRILVRATNPDGRTIEVSVLCTDPRCSIEEAVTLMFNRWIQENDFRCLDRHFGLMQITTYASAAYARIQDRMHDRPAECPEYRELKSRLQQEEQAWGKLLVEREKLQHRRDVCTRELRRLERQNRSIADQPTADPGCPSAAAHTSRVRRRRTERRTERARKLRRGIAALRRKLAGLPAALATVQTRLDEQQQRVEAARAQRDSALRDDSRLKLLIQQNYCQLDTRCKELMDAIKITARNVFRRLLEIFRPLYDNYRDDHLLLRLLTRCSGIVRRRGQTTCVEIWLKGHFQPAQRRVFATFLRTMTDFINGHFGDRYAPVEIRLLHRPEVV